MDALPTLFYLQESLQAVVCDQVQNTEDDVSDIFSSGETPAVIWIAAHVGVLLINKYMDLTWDCVKLGVRTEMSGPKSCEVLTSTCRLRRSLDGCLKFWRSRWSRRVRSRAEKKLKADESELREVAC